MQLLSLIFICFTFTACKDADKRAQDVVYPTGYVNENYKPLSEPPTGSLETMLDEKYHVYYGPGLDENVIIYFHGNGENLTSLAKVGMLRALSYRGNFVAVDYPGYGLSKGTPSEKTLVDSGVLAVKFAREMFPKRRVILWGWSLGSGVAALVANKVKPDQLILVSPWDTMKDLMLSRSDAAKNVSKSWYSKNEYNVLENARRFMFLTSVFIVDGDKSIPNNHSLNTFNAINANLSDLYTVRVAKHNQVYTSHYFWETLDEVLQTNYLKIDPKSAKEYATKYFIDRRPSHAN